jgi:iron(III) transport system permease protein
VTASGRTGRAPVWLRLVSLGLAALFAFPGAYLLWRNFTEAADPWGLLISERTLDPLGRTLRLAVLVALTTAVFGTALAWFTTRTDLPGRRAWRVILPVPLVFPTFIGAAAFIRTLNPGGLASDFFSNVGFDGAIEMRGLFGAWLVLSLFTYPYVYLLVAARLRRLPGALEESARVLGSHPPLVFARVVLPQIASAIAAGTLLVFLYSISDFGAVQLMRYDTLTRAIETTQLSNPPVALALSLILLVLAGIVVIAERAASARLPSFDTARTSRPVEYRLGWWRLPALGFVVLSAFLAVGAPMIAIVDWAVDGLMRESRGGRPLTIDQAEVLEATRNTVLVSTVTAVVAVLAVLPIAFLVGRYRSKTGVLSHAVVVATFALPGILIALAMRFWTLQSDWANEHFYDTMVLLIFAYVVRFGALAIGAVLIAVQSVPHQLHDAARTLGAGRVRRLLTVDLQTMAPGLLAGGGLVLLSTMKELPISLLVSPLGFSTLATRIFTSFEDAFVAEAGIMALVLVSLSFLLTWLFVIRKADHL